MTPEQETLIVAMRDVVAEPERFSYDRLVGMCEDGFVGKPVRMPPPTDEHSGYYKAEPSTAGALVLAIAAERDRLDAALKLERLRSAWLEKRFACADAGLDLSSASEYGAHPDVLTRIQSEVATAEIEAEKALAAYKAAGGKVLWPVQSNHQKYRAWSPR